MPKNFVAISGITTRKQLDRIHEIAVEEKIDFPLCIGYRVSHKSIHQGTANSRQPSFAELEQLLCTTESYGFLNGVHYYTKENETIPQDIEEIRKKGRFLERNIILQSNTLPPNPEVLRKIKRKGFDIIFKIAVSDKNSANGGYAVWKGETVEDVSKGDSNILIQSVLERSDAINYAMFDPSHGTNLSLDLSEQSLGIQFGRAIISYHGLDHIGLVYAGGINPRNVRSVRQRLGSNFPKRFSIDIESGVRTNDKLDMKKVRRYLRACNETWWN